MTSLSRDAQNSMRGSFVKSFLLAGLSLVILGESASAQVDALPTNRYLKQYGLEMYWWGQATLNPKRETVKNVMIDEEGVIVQASSGMITAFDSETGQKLWSNLIGRYDQAGFKPVANGDLILVINGLSMYAINRRTGDIKWQIGLPQYPSTGPAMDDNQIYVGTLDGSVYAFDIRKIAELYNDGKLPQWSESARAWRYKTGKEITSTPISTGRVVNFASLDGSLYSVTARSRRIQWQFETDAPVSAPVTTNGRSLFLASQDFNFYCLGAENGQVRWSFVSGLPIKKAPYAINNHVFISPERGGLFCIEIGEETRKIIQTSPIQDPDNPFLADDPVPSNVKPKLGGKEVWPRPVPNVKEFIAATPKTVFASDEQNNILIIDRMKGEIRGKLPFRRFSVHPANNLTDRLFLSTESGLVIAIREVGREYPIYHLNPDRKPIIPMFEGLDDAGESPAGLPDADSSDDPNADGNAVGF